MSQKETYYEYFYMPQISAFFYLCHASASSELVVCWNFWFWSGIPVDESQKFPGNPAEPAVSALLSLWTDGRQLHLLFLSLGLYFAG